MKLLARVGDRLRGPRFEAQPRLRRHRSTVNFPLSYVAFGVALFLSFVVVTFPPFRYTFFAIPFFVLMAVLGDREIRVGDEIHSFLIICMAAVVLGPLGIKEGLKDAFLIFAGVSIGLVANLPKISVRTLFFINIVCMVVFFAIFGDKSQMLAFDFEHSQSPFEGNFGFIFGMLAVFAMLDRKWLLAACCIVMSVAALKRVALLGAVMAGIFVLMGPRLGRKILNPLVMILINLGIVMMTLHYAVGDFNHLITSLTGQSANQLGEGRQILYLMTANKIFADPWKFGLYGDGPGSVYTLLGSRAGEVVHGSLHSDLLKICYEYGFLIFTIFIGSMYMSKSYSVRVACLFMNVLYATDNCLIYYFLLFPFIVLTRAAQEKEELEAAGGVPGDRPPTSEAPARAGVRRRMPLNST